MHGTELKAIRDRLRLTQKQLGELMGCGYQAIAREERADEVDKRTELAALYLAEHPERTFGASTDGANSPPVQPDMPRRRTT